MADKTPAEGLPPRCLCWPHFLLSDLMVQAKGWPQILGLLLVLLVYP